MGERYTSIRLPRVHGASLADYGRKTPSEMIDQLRACARSDIERSAAILAASDEEFHVEIYTGFYVRKNIEILQKSTAREGGSND